MTGGILESDESSLACTLTVELSIDYKFTTSLNKVHYPPLLSILPSYQQLDSHCGLTSKLCDLCINRQYVHLTKLSFSESVINRAR